MCGAPVRAVSALQSAVWLTFSPIEDEVKSKYGVSAQRLLIRACVCR